MLACGKNMGYWLEKGIIYYGDKWGNNAHEFILPTNLYCPRIARMDTNRFNGLNGDRVGRTNLHECKEGDI